MAKSKMIFEKSMKDCFIQIREKSSFESSVETDNPDEKEEGHLTVPNINKTLSVTRNIAGIERSESSNGSGDSGGSDSPGNNSPEAENETGDDNKSDYDAESFFSDDSCCKESEVTNVTPRSSLSGSSSLLHSAGLKYDKRITELIRSRRSGGRRRDGEENEDALSSVGSDMKYLSEEEATMMIDRRQLTRSGRRNMSFTNEQLRKIERENQLLLKKIMSHQKPQIKSVKPNSVPPRTSSSAINRKKQQKKIEEDNMILLRRIQQAKPCAMPRASAPSCRLETM